MASCNRLMDKVAIITGAGAGIGRTSALLFAREGARIVASDIDLERAQATAKDIEKAGGECIAVQADVTSVEEVEAMVKKAIGTFGRVDVLMNCAGIMPIMPVWETSEEVWDQVIDINLKGTFLCCKFAILEMQRTGGGSIVNIASGAGITGVPGLSAYCASKAGVLLLTKSMALDCVKDNIRINCLAPGVIDTDLNRSWLNEEDDPEQALRDLEAVIPIHRMGTPEEVAYCALFLASDESSYVTGHPLVVDGGLIAD